MHQLEAGMSGSEGREFLSGGGEMGALMRAHDWSATPLGSPAFWPQRLRSIVNVVLTSRFAMWMGWGEDLTFFYNDAYAPTLGVKHGWALGRPSREGWSEIWPDIGPRIERVLTTGEATWDEALLLFLERRGYAEETYHTFSYSPLLDDEGAIAGHLCVVSEETDKVIGERRLRTLRDLADRLSGSASERDVLDAVAASLTGNARDLPFTATYLWGEAEPEPQLATSTGFRPGSDVLLRLASSQGAALWQPGAIRSGADRLEVDLPQEVLGGLPAGEWQAPPRRALVVPIARQGQEQPAGFLTVGLNPHRRLDESYADFIGLIAGQIASGLANSRAYEEERRRAHALAELDRAKTEFFSNISHEFRTPLTLMLNPVEQLQERLAENEPARALLDVAHRNALRLLRLVNSLLDFSRIEAGRTQASYEPVDFSAFTAELASAFRSVAEQAGLALIIDAPPLAEPVYVDRDMWEKVVLNLLSNAFKFTLEGKIQVRVSSSEDGHAAVVQIRDTGIGIPAQELPHLFERFHRVSGARGRSIEGSGIGLALVRELISLHGGAVWADSELGQGTVFTVTVPFGTAHLPAERIQAAKDLAPTPLRANVFVAEAMRWLPSQDPSAAPALPLPSGTGPSINGRIVLADDNADMRGYIARLLTDAGAEVEAVADGQAALEAIAANRPDLVLTDVMMPRLDGFGLLQAIRSQEVTRSLPVMLLSARAGEDARVEGLRAGADDYLVKPFIARELVANVESSLKLGKLRQTTEDKMVGQKQILELIATGRPVSETLESIVRFIEEQEPAAIASILVVAPDGKHFLRSTGPNLPDSFHDTLEGLSVEPPFTGTCPDALASCQPLSVPDVRRDTPYAQFWRDLLLSNGLESVRSTPVLDAAGRPIASLAIYYREPRDPAPADPELIGIATHMIAIALERSRDEGELRDTAARLRRAQQAGEIADWTWSLPDDSITTTGEIEAVFGMPAEQLPRTAEAFFARVPESDRAVLLASLQPMLRGEENRFQAEFPFRDANEEIRWLAARAETVERDSNGRALRIVGVNFDVSSRRATEEQLRDNEERLRLIIESAKEYAIITADPNGVITGWNSGAQRILGFEEAEVLGRSIDILFTKEDAELGIPRRELETALTGAPATNERWHVRRDGTRFFASGFTLRLANGHTRGVLIIFRDRTAERQLEEEIERRSAELDALLAAVPVAVWFTYDREGAHAQGNQRAAEMFRVPVERNHSLIGNNKALLPYRAFQAGHEVDPVYLPLSRAARGETISNEVFQVRFSDGFPELEVSCSAVPLRDNSGEVIGAVCSATDVTSLREAERKVRELNETLEARVAERTTELELTQARLAHAQRMEALGQLAGGIAHDFNNVVQAVQGCAALIARRANDPERVRSLATMMADAAARGAAITRRLLAFSRRGDLRAEPVDAASLLAGMQEILAHTLGAGVRIRLEVEGSLPPLLADRGQLETVLVNLATNSRDAMAGKGILGLAAMVTTVTEEAPSELPVPLQSGRYVCISVSDTGSGMAPDVLARASEPFFTTKVVGQGTGLGLAMARGFVEQSGGALHIESEQGRGTIVHLWLPVATKDVTTREGETAPEQGAALATGSRARLLIVDDEMVVLETLAEQLREEGYEVLTAESGAEALTILDSGHDVNLVIADLSMPVMDGLTFLREARRRNRFVPTILLTGFATNAAEVAMSGAMSGQFTLLRKPVDGPVLAARIQLMLQGEPARGRDN